MSNQEYRERIQGMIGRIENGEALGLLFYLAQELLLQEEGERDEA